MTIQQLLDKNNVGYKTSGNWLGINCFWCHHKKNKLFINMQHGGYWCVHCGQKGKWQYIAEQLGVAEEVELNPVSSVVEFDLPPLDKGDIEMWNAIVPPDVEKYLHEKRGLTDETIRKFKIGWDGKSITIPIADYAGNYINIKYRSDPTRPTDKKAMWNLTGHGSMALFNETVLAGKTKKDRERIIICEGEFDCMLLDQMGYNAVCSTGGVQGFKSEWVSAFEKFEKVYICFDNDRNKAGAEALEKVAKTFVNQGVRPWIIRLPSPGVLEKKLDVTDFFISRRKTKKDFTMLLKEASEYTGSTLPQNALTFISGEDLYDMKFPKQEWLVETLVPKESICCLAGLPATMKSYVSNYMASCILQGEKMFNRFETEKVPILFIDKENKLQRIYNRFSALGMDASPDVHFLSKGNFDLMNRDHIAIVENMIIKKNIGLVILDTMVRMHTKNENDASEMNQVYQQMAYFKNAGASVLFIHHFNRRGIGQYATTNVNNLLRGSGDILGQVDNYFALETVQKGILKLTVGKTRDEDVPVPFLIEAVFEEKSVTFRYLHEVEEGEGDEVLKSAFVYNDILSMVDTVTSVSRQQICDRFNEVSVSTIDRVLSQLVIEEKLILYKEGRINMYRKPSKILDEDKPF